MRVLILVTHLLGVGHLSRAAALARGLAQAGERVTLISGGRPVPLLEAEGYRFVQLPPVHCRDADFSTLLGDNGKPVSEALLEERRRLILQSLAGFAPDVVITETYPFGRRQLRAEFRALVEAAKRRDEPALVLASIRDILNPPSNPDRRKREAERVLAAWFDGVLQHGGDDAPLRLSFPTSPGMERIVRRSGLIAGRDEAPSDERVVRTGILVSGGGSAAALPLFRASLDAARRSAEPWRILVGHGVGEADFAGLAQEASGNTSVERARSDFRELLKTAAVSVSQAGYNTAIDLAATGTPAVLVPFSQGAELEQSLRAEAIGKAGRAVVLSEDRLSADSLLTAVETARERVPAAPPCPTSGQAGALAAIRSFRQEFLDLAEAGRALRTALDALAASGRTTDVWWRDDDAEAPGDRLDRLLDLARRFDIPLALAVSPALATPALADRLQTEPRVSVLVHGYAHRNHAPVDRKKQELGYRPVAAMAEELQRGLSHLTELFGSQLLPVLVPPWNRIDPALVPDLASLGFRGISTFKAREAARVHGLTCVNTHLDPIDWRAGTVLKPKASLLRDLVHAFPTGEPVGLLTHHLVHDEWIWHFVEELLEILAGHPAVRFPTLAQILQGPELP